MENYTNCIWLVDDDDDDLMLLQAAFQKADPELRIKILHDGEDLLPQLRQTGVSPNLVLLDLNMARSSGLETLMHLRSTSQYTQLPVVILTTSSNQTDRHRSQVLGANDYHTKPDNFNDLAQLASTLIRQWLPKSEA